jgi:hypothetical protein
VENLTSFHTDSWFSTYHHSHPTLPGENDVGERFQWERWRRKKIDDRSECGEGEEWSREERRGEVLRLYTHICVKNELMQLK